MPTAKPRAAPRRKKIAENPLQAEAAPDEFAVAFEWRGHAFVVDTKAVQYGRAAFALRVATNESQALLTRVNAMLDVYEAAIGQDQLAIAVELEPRLFDDPEAAMSFWQAMTAAVHGGEPGESSAS
jgi:hypothetical protein